MPFLFQNQQKPDSATSAGFIVPERQIAYGPGVIVLAAIFGMTIVAWAALFSFKSKIDADIELTRYQIDDLERKRDKVLETEILVFSRRLSALSKIIDSHVYTSKLFPVIESLTLPSVFYSSMSLSFDDDTNPGTQGVKLVKVDLHGKAANLLELARQLVVLRSDPVLKDGDVTAFSFEKEAGNIDFSAMMAFDVKVLQAAAK